MKKNAKRAAFPAAALTLLCLCLCLCFCLMTACTGGKPQPAPETDGGTTLPATEADPDTTSRQPPETQPQPGEETALPPEIESETEAGTQPGPGSVPTSSDFLTFPRDALTFVRPSDSCELQVVEENGGTLLRVETKSKSLLTLTVDCDALLGAYGLEPVSASEYPVMAVVLRRESLTYPSLTMTFRAGDMKRIDTNNRTERSYAADAGAEEYVILDLSSNSAWSGSIHEFKLQLAKSSKNTGETVFLSAVRFFTNVRDALVAAGADVIPPDQLETMIEPVLVDYKKQDAPDEDPSVALWFDHATQKVNQADTTSSGRETYVIRMAGNSIEGCQFFLAPEAERTFRITLSDFTDAEGHTLKTRLFTEGYNLTFGVWGDLSTAAMIPDALPPYLGDVTVAGGTSQGFLIKAWTETDTPAGLYTARLDVYDAVTGKHIKTAEVYTSVWGFSLGEDTRLKTAVNLPLNAIVAPYLDKTMLNYDAWTLYRMYYDFLLENRICAYALPYDLYSVNALPYLDNPRVTAFAVNAIDGGAPGYAYSILSNDPKYLEKGFFYYVDEPSDQAALNRLHTKTNELKSVYPGFRQVAPFFTDFQSPESDQIEAMKEDLSIWCTKIFAFTPRELSPLAGTQYLTSTAQDAKYGTFADRMAREKAEGDELWTYYCWEPGDPYVNWLITDDGCEPLVSVWLNKLVGATGMLYWHTMNYSACMASAPTGERVVYGDGVLLYPGPSYGIYEPVSCVRLESIRMGIQDYQMLCMLEELAGTQACGEMVARIAHNVVCYATDDDYIHAVRVLLGDTLEQLMKN